MGDRGVLPHHVDRERFRQVTGGDLNLVAENISLLAKQCPQKVIVRIPVIPGFNSGIETLKAILDQTAKLGLKRADLLPYHTLAAAKWQRMALIAFTCFLIPSHPQLRRTQRRLGLLFLALLAFTVILLTPWGEGLINALPLKEYQKNRILSAINPFADQYNTGYQLINGLVSFATGGWFGLGFGNSVRKYTNFPAANTDFILAIIVEELGIVGFLAVFIPYCIIIIQLFRYAQKIRSEKAKIILVGTAMYFLIHMIFNIGGVTGLIPLTGVPLLMISAGGSSTLSIMCCVGFSQAVIAKYKQGEIE